MTTSSPTSRTSDSPPRLLHGRVAILVAVLAVLGTPRAFAGEDIPWYHVELIIFSQGNPETAHEEAWPEDPGYPDFDNAITLPEPPANPSPGAPESVPTFRAAMPEEFTLLSQEKRLRNARVYQPLAHMAWIQPGVGEAQAPLVRVSTAPVATEGLFDPGAPVLEGTIRVYRGRYLHLRADLLYHQPGLAGPPDLSLAFDDALPDPERWAYRMQQHRRMRSKELHYLDHPVLGILVQATPLEDDEEP